MQGRCITSVGLERSGKSDIIILGVFELLCVCLLHNVVKKSVGWVISTPLVIVQVRVLMQRVAALVLDRIVMLLRVFLVLVHPASP